MDAAIATVFALNAAESFASGIGGGGFMVIFLAKEKRATVINFREKAPAKANPSMYLDKENVQDIFKKPTPMDLSIKTKSRRKTRPTWVSSTARETL